MFLKPSAEKIQYLFFLFTHSFILGNILSLWFSWICKVLFSVNVGWMFLLLRNMLVNCLIFFLLLKIPKAIKIPHILWNKIKNHKLSLWISNLKIHFPFIFGVVLSSLLFSYYQLSNLPVYSKWSVIPIALGIITFLRNVMISYLLLIQLLIDNKRINLYWSSNSLIKKRFVSSSTICYGPSNMGNMSPNSAENAAKTLWAAVGGAVGALVLRKTETAPRETAEDANAALKRASKAGQKARELAEQCERELQKLETIVPLSSAQEQFREARIKDLLSSQQQSLRDGDKAVAIESGISAVQKTASKMSAPEQGLRSLLPNSPQSQIRELDSHTSVLITQNDALKQELLRKGEMNSVLEDSLFSLFFKPFYSFFLY